MGRFETIRSAAVPLVDHPVFGPLRGTGRTVDNRWCWEALELIDTPRGRADLSFEAGPNGPGPAHEGQFGELVSNLDRLTTAALPSITSAASELGTAELEWQGAHLTGEQGSFQLHYASERCPDAMISVRFEESVPVIAKIGD